MIKTGYKYTAFSPKKTKTGKTYFSIQDFDKSKPTESKKYCTVFTTNEIELNDRDKVNIVKIDSISLGEYQGKLQVSMFAEIKLDGESIKQSVDEHLNQMAGQNIVVQSDDLPF
jgi:hypothetical protein